MQSAHTSSPRMKKKLAVTQQASQKANDKHRNGGNRAITQYNHTITKNHQCLQASDSTNDTRVNKTDHGYDFEPTAQHDNRTRIITLQFDISQNIKWLNDTTWMTKLMTEAKTWDVTGIDNMIYENQLEDFNERVLDELVELQIERLKADEASNSAAKKKREDRMMRVEEQTKELERSLGMRDESDDLAEAWRDGLDGEIGNGGEEEGGDEGESDDEGESEDAEEGDEVEGEGEDG